MNRFDGWIDGAVAWTSREVLVPVDGPDAPIFPPTFAASESRKEQADWDPYIIDKIGDKNVCLVDGYASQSNRMELPFADPPYATLVPQHAVQITPDRLVMLRRAPHRVGDASVRFSGWREPLAAALRDFANGDAEPLARIDPLSLVFGFFDARGTMIKSQRLVTSSIRAYDVSELRCRGQYQPPVNYVKLGLVPEPQDKPGSKALAQEGLVDNPFPNIKHPARGGVIVRGEILRHTSINLVALRALRASSEEATRRLRRYLLGLSLVAATYAQEYSLRQGCLLRRASSPEQRLAMREGEEKLTSDHGSALVFAQEAAKAFGVERARVLPFNDKALAEWVAKPKAERKAARQAKQNSTVAGSQDEPDGDEDADATEEE